MHKVLDKRLALFALVVGIPQRNPLSPLVGRPKRS
jgi:hypothetical protein